MVASQTAFDFGKSSAPEPASILRQAPECPAPSVQPPNSPVAPRVSASARPAREFDARANEQLEAALRGTLPVPVRVTLTDNRRTMITLEKSPRLMHVRLHHMFAQADPSTLHALGAYLASADRQAAQHIGRFIEQHRESIRGRTVRPVPLSAVGLHYNLNEIYRDVNGRYFDGKVDAKITWSRGAQLKSRRRRNRSIKLGSYTARDRLIRVHPALDAEYVPRFFVEYIVYHEMLHHVVPPKRSGKRRSLHGPEFMARERDFAEIDAALAWERENLDRLLRARAKKSGGGRF